MFHFLQEQIPNEANGQLGESPKYTSYRLNCSFFVLITERKRRNR